MTASSLILWSIFYAAAAKRAVVLALDNEPAWTGLMPNAVELPFEVEIVLKLA
jgi:hypothetical protein